MAKGSKTKVEFFGTAELLKKLEKAGANIESECVKALQASCQKPKSEMISFMSNHKRTGKTLDSFYEKYETNKGIISCEVGFDANKSLGALFWNLGTPYRAPTHFIDKAVDENIDEIKKKQLEVLQNAFKELS